MADRKERKRVNAEKRQENWVDRLVAVNRVSKVVKGGRRFSFNTVVVVGNEDGLVGAGLGKANEVSSAISKGADDAKKNVIRVPLRDGTIPHKVVGEQDAGHHADQEAERVALDGDLRPPGAAETRR
ncbi:MAG: hypothetical protein ABEK84_09095, partial [Salinibacter sp.]